MELILDKYTYPSIVRDDDSADIRLYKTPDNDLVPSVTSILSKTKDTKYLDEWRKRVGEEEAKRITQEACSIGTKMHNYLECYILDEKYKVDYNPRTTQAISMAEVIIEEGLCHVDEIWGSEVQLYYKDQYAGTTDLVGLYKGKPYIIDFKQTNRPKKKEWIEDYFLQLCAYAHAHNELTGTEISGGVVLMCSRDLQFQKFEMDEIQFQKYSYMWFNRVKEYRKLVNLDT
jgi:genome maintenance exonuclease 1